ncbi:MAG TPA: DUF6094 domain-containing protein [Gammaproteobacteria bacterium]|nr:DUF6094 domain-containing protein [Gammaproteobacteria bacterium]HVY53385.1 DUF6094 domain-containing protein [Gammaproteobacteria bacterium]
MLFQRLARNFIKFGYFPTDSETLKRILNALVPAESGQLAIFDPTAGEGVALAECKYHLGQDRTTAYGVEIDEERAWHAKTLLDHCIQGDLMDCIISKNSFGLMFLNPPYGDLTKDQSGGHYTMEGRARLEKLYYRRTISTLQKGGVLVLIVPHASLDATFAEWISRHLVQVKVYLAPEQQYKQVVLFGIRADVDSNEARSLTRKRLVAIGEGELPEMLPEEWLDTPYTIPAVKTAIARFSISQLDARQLLEMINNSPCLWTQFSQRFGQPLGSQRRPLMDLSQWHLALALAAGQVSGVVSSQDGRTFLIRGSTYKTQTETFNYEVDEEGKETEVRTRLDRFIPALRALDMTPESRTFGRLLTIR